MNKIVTSAPGRICLFGEHQDYMGLPVITAAINLRIVVQGEVISDKILNIQLPDIKSKEIINFSQKGKIKYSSNRDYLKSVFNILYRKNISLSHGFNCTIKGNIPINSGTSSSTALTNAWCYFLIKASNTKNNRFHDKQYIAELSHLAEVIEFDEPGGGMMDQIATSLGGLLFIDCKEKTSFKKLPFELGTFVLGDSLEPKDTLGILRRVENTAKNAIKKIRYAIPDFDLTIDISKEYHSIFRRVLTSNEINIIEGMIINQCITRKALSDIFKYPFNDKDFGNLLTSHHKVLDEKFGISTPKINAMIDSAINAGAYGGKINGSGGGGCMFVYAPENPERVLEAIEKEGGKGYIVKVDKGLF